MRHIKLFKYLFFALFICCKTNSDKADIATVKEDMIVKKDGTTSFIENDTIVKEQTEVEYLSEMMFVNNDYPFEGKKNELISLIKKADSIRKQEDDCGAIIEDSTEIWYYLNCELEVSKTNYAFREIDFKHSNFTIKHNNVTFSKNYTIQNFKEDFPVSFMKNKEDEKNRITTITMKTHPLSDDIYIFKFHDNSLVRLRYFFPC